MDSTVMGGDLANDLFEESYVVSTESLEDENNSDSGQYKNAPLREQDRFLPIANIAKIMKRAIPDNGKISKDARECVQECISEFISFVTSEASDRCQIEKRKTINGEDVIFAMNTLGFDNYIEPLKVYLRKYREMVLSPVTVQKLSKGVVYGLDCGDNTPTYKVEPPAPQTAEEDASNTTVIYTFSSSKDSFTPLL